MEKDVVQTAFGFLVPEYYQLPILLLFLSILQLLTFES